MRKPYGPGAAHLVQVVHDLAVTASGGAVEGHGSPGAPRLAMRELEHLQVPVLGGRLAGPSVELALCVVQQGDEANVSRGCCCVGRGACVQRALPFLNEHARDLGAAAPGCHPGDPQVGFQVWEPLAQGLEGLQAPRVGAHLEDLTILQESQIFYKIEEINDISFHLH